MFRQKSFFIVQTRICSQYDPTICFFIETSATVILSSLHRIFPQRGFFLEHLLLYHLFLVFQPTGKIQRYIEKMFYLTVTLLCLIVWGIISNPLHSTWQLFFVSNLSPSYQTLQQLGTKENFGFNLVFYFYSLIKILYLSQLEFDAFFLEGFTWLGK